MNKLAISMLAPAIAAALMLGAPAQADSVNVTLGPEHTGAYIQNYYLGGADSVASDGNGPSLGVGFSSNAQVQKAGDSVTTGNGKFENNLTGETETLDFASSTATSGTYSGASYLNFAQGFSGISFNYALATNSANYNTIAQIYSGLNGTGTLLETINLNSNGAANACVTRNDAYCNWIGASSTAFAGSAESVLFSSSPTAQAGINTLNDAEFDGISLTPTTPVPLPAAVWLLLSGLGGLGIFRRKGSGAAV
jgi:hypothetical protein